MADRLIKCSLDRIAVEFSTHNQSGEPVKLAALPRPEDEAEVVAMNIEQLWKQGVTPPREMAVFYRTNDMSRLVEQALTKRQIPYKVVGSGSYYDRMEIKDVLSMLRFLCNPHDGISFARIANKPARGMGDAVIGRVEAHAERHGMDLISALAKNEDVRDEQDRPLTDAARRACDDALSIFCFDTSDMTVHEVVMEVLSRTTYDKWLKEKYEEKNEYEGRQRNVTELTNSIAEFCGANRKATIGDYLQSISPLHQQRRREGRQRRAADVAAREQGAGVRRRVHDRRRARHPAAREGRQGQRRGRAGGGATAVLRRLHPGPQAAAGDVVPAPAGHVRPQPHGQVQGVSRPSRFLLEAGLMTQGEYDTAVAEARFGTGKAQPQAS